LLKYRVEPQVPVSDIIYITMPSPLSVAILRTLAYFDIFDYPLTVSELWRWLWPDPAQPVGEVTVEQVQQALKFDELRGRVGMVDDYVVLTGREGIVKTRSDRQPANVRKWKRAESAARFLELVPFVQLVAVSNTLAINNARPESDIDFFIVTSGQHIWIARFLVTGIISLLGWRRHGQKITNRICLSFYITTSALDLSPLKSAEPDPHFTFWVSQIVPLMDDDQTYEKFRAANPWVTATLPNAWKEASTGRVLAPNSSLCSIKKFYEVFFSSPIGIPIENWTRNHQMKRFTNDTTGKSKEPGNDVIISEDVLKFHEEDRRGKYNQKVGDRLKGLGL